MIRFVERDQLNEKLYNQCISDAVNTRIYAYSWYLDAVADNWSVLVLNNYEVVMPLPWRSKFFIKYIYPPAWTQQLGVFFKEKISLKTMESFFSTIPNKFKKSNFLVNSDCFKLKTFSIRNNFILNLNKNYEAIYKNYTKNRKRDLGKAKLIGFKLNEFLTNNEFLDAYLKQEKKYKISENQINTLKNLLNLKRKEINVWGLLFNNEVVGEMIWLDDSKRITLLVLNVQFEFKKFGVSTLLVDMLIKKYAETNYIFDFEGSMISGIAKFYQSFGAEKEKYYLFSKKLFN
ncbi:MAG: hypothetical protein ACWA42_05775 [Lutibacter sp.]